MTDAKEVLDRIEEVLGHADDVAIEWDISTSPDAMRSRPTDEAAEWGALLERIASLPWEPPVLDPATFADRLSHYIGLTRDIVYDPDRHGHLFMSADLVETWAVALWALDEDGNIRQFTQGEQ